MAGSTGAARDALLWARSIRDFGGRFAEAPIWVCVPEHKERLSAATRVEFDKLAVQLPAFKIDSAELDFPFGGKTIAAAAAETLAQGRASFLVWMDRDSLLIREPESLLLSGQKALGYRPVDHTLIGSRFSSPPDPFWSLIYNYLGVDAQALTPMRTPVDEETIRPYFNAGMIVVRPQHHLLRAWANNFKRLYTLPAFKPFYEQDILYRLFMHQATLAGTLLALTGEDERSELPHLVNYPLHMHASYPSSRRPARLNDVTAFRYDTLVNEARWEELIPIEEPLQSWLVENRQAQNSE